jgi:hypothetical protein
LAKQQFQEFKPNAHTNTSLCHLPKDRRFILRLQILNT